MSYKETIKAGSEFAAEQFGEAAKAVISLAQLEEQRLKTDGTIAETLKQLYQRRAAIDKTIAEVEKVQRTSKE